MPHCSCTVLGVLYQPFLLPVTWFHQNDEQKSQVRTRRCTLWVPHENIECEQISVALDRISQFHMRVISHYSHISIKMRENLRKSQKSKIHATRPLVATTLPLVNTVCDFIIICSHPHRTWEMYSEPW